MNLSVCEIGATIGRMWRELKDDEKQKHNDDFTQAKVGTTRYLWSTQQTYDFLA